MSLVLSHGFHASSNANFSSRSDHRGFCRGHCLTGLEWKITANERRRADESGPRMVPTAADALMRGLLVRSTFGSGER
jgi:hypothetical protein